MKKYYVCFFILAVLLAAAVFTGSYFYVFRPEPERAIPNGVVETESVPEDNMVVSQRIIVEKHSEEASKAPLDAAQGKQYCLVAENGFLLVFAKDRDTVCLDTHMPLSEFPEEEQQRLMEGIWFSTMLEIFNYLESYSS